MKISEKIAWGLALSGWAAAVDYAFIPGGVYSHPYDMCVEKGFTDPVDIGECIWLLEHQESLR